MYRALAGRPSLARELSLFLLTSVVQLMFAQPAMAIDYPGPAPGVMVAKVDATAITLGNQAMRIRWDYNGTSLRLRSIEDLRGGTTLNYTGDLFAVSFTGRAALDASSLIVDEKPQIIRLNQPRKGIEVQLKLRSQDGRVSAVWRAAATDQANYVRQELDVLPSPANIIRGVQWFKQWVPSAQTMGAVDGSPVVIPPFFLGCEDPHASNVALPEKQGGSTVTCMLARNAPVSDGASLKQSFVIGVAPSGQTRRAFLHYIERERAHPYRQFLHYNSWYDTAWEPFALGETNCLEAIRLIGENLVKTRGVRMDSMVFDDGWDDPHTLWKFHAGFPNGFTPLARSCKAYKTHLGVWLSPFGGYGESRDRRLQFGKAQGYETNGSGFSLAGPKYYQAFKDACVRMLRSYGVNHFKFDGIAAGMSARGGAEYVLDTEAMRRLMLELRAENPELFINLTTGSWPSPFWLRYADSVWRQGGDMGLAGVGPRQQQWITYRDQETYRNIVKRGPLYPLNSLMTQGVAFSRKGSAGDPSFDSDGFKDDVHAFFGSGTGLQELYIQPARLSGRDWDVLAEAARWARKNTDVLVDTHWVGGDPGQLQPYGYASWSRRKGITMLRNPSDVPQQYQLDVKTAFELPGNAPLRYTLRDALPSKSEKLPTRAVAGNPLTIQLAPFQVRLIEAIPD